MKCLNTKGKYGKVTDAKIKCSIFSKSVTTVIFMELINQLIDYPIICASLSNNPKHWDTLSIYHMSRVDRKTIASQMVVFPNT